MTYEQLAHIADIINHNSPTYFAVIPPVTKGYMQQVGTELTPTSCLTLSVMIRGKAKNHVRRTCWKVYEQDMENTIVKLQRKDAHIAQRYADNKLTVRDVEVIIRRSTYSALKLKMVPIGLENLQ